MRDNYMLLLIFEIILFFLIPFLLVSFEKKNPTILEEAIPIRSHDSIVGMNYIIKITKDNNNDHIIVEPSIYDSIYHYKDIDSIEFFFIDLDIDNQSNYLYLLKNISLIGEKKYFRDVDYQINSYNSFTFKLNRKDFLNHFKIKIELER